MCSVPSKSTNNVGVTLLYTGGMDGELGRLSVTPRRTDGRFTPILAFGNATRWTAHLGRKHSVTTGENRPKAAALKLACSMLLRPFFCEDV